MRVKDLKNEMLKKRVETHHGFVCQKEFSPGSPVAEAFNQLILPDGDGFIMLPRDNTIQIDASFEDKGSLILP